MAARAETPAVCATSRRVSTASALQVSTHWCLRLLPCGSVQLSHFEDNLRTAEGISSIGGRPGGVKPQARRVATSADSARVGSSGA